MSWGVGGVVWLGWYLNLDDEEWICHGEWVVLCG